MKLKSYRLLFQLFSALSDRTNGAPLFVKYKLLLGTLILGVASSSANKSTKEMTCYDGSEIHPVQVTCYKPTVRKYDLPELNLDSVEVKGTVIDERGEPVIGVSVVTKNTKTGVVTDLDGNFRLKATSSNTLVFSFIGLEGREILVSEIIESNPIIMKDSGIELSCYVVVTAEYMQRQQGTYLSYDEVEIPPVSPAGDLDKFKDWIQSNIKYTECMRNDSIQGEVVVRFVIDAEGRITNRWLVEKISPDADAEILRVLMSSDKWKPGIHNGKVVKTEITIPVKFALD